MLKKNLKKIILVMLLIIICTGAGVYGAIVTNATKVTYSKLEGGTMTVKEALDDLYSKAPLSTGDIVTYKGEEFYVLNAGKDTVELFAKTNINQDCTAQANATNDQTAILFCSYSENSSYSSLVSSSNQNMNLNNINGFSDYSAIGRARKYARNKGAISGRLLTYEEANSLKGTYPEMISGYGNTSQSYSGHGYEHYWLGSYYLNTVDRKVWVVWGTFGLLSGDYYYCDDMFGVRPVLEVYKSDIS